MRWNSSRNSRTMPWKGETDPYRIWLSEVILQQTRVEQGTAYYNRFVAAFPTIKHLASAPESRVFKLWEGLGYYSRCKNLLHTARHISENLGGRFPGNYNQLLSLKGVGPYTAAAIASFAFNERRAVVDGNVIRVIARYFGIASPATSAQGRKLFDEMAQSLIDKKRPGLYNQAIMDFGATVCRPRNPLCDVCVQKKGCEAFRHGVTSMLPVKKIASPKRTRWFHYYVIERGGSVFIRKRVEKDIWENLYEFFLLESDGPGDARMPAFLRKTLDSKAGSAARFSREYTQQLSHQKIIGRFVTCKLGAGGSPPAGFIAVKRQALLNYPFPRLINAFLEEEQLPD